MTIAMTAARRKALDAEKKKHIHNRMKQYAQSASAEADSMFGGTPFRVSYRVAIKKPRAYYEAAQAAVCVLLSRPYLLNMKSSEMLAEINKRVQFQLGNEASINRVYWYKELTTVQLQQIALLMNGYAYVPSQHNQLNLIADLLRYGPACADAAADRPTGGDTSSGAVRFADGTHVQLFGVDRSVRWRRGKPYIRDTGGTEQNLFTLLEGAGVLQDTVKLWVDNAEARAALISEQGETVAQRIKGTAAFDKQAANMLQPDDPSTCCSHEAIPQA